MYVFFDGEDDGLWVVFFHNVCQEQNVKLPPQ